MKTVNADIAELGLMPAAEFTEARASERFGAAVAANGDTVLVGDPVAGTVVAYRRSGSGWRRRTISAPGGMLGFGQSVATGPAGDVIGAWQRRETETGAVFALEGSGLRQIARSDGDTIVGHAVASGQSGIAYTQRAGTDGLVVVQTKAGARQIALPAGQRDHFGASLAASGDRLAVLAPAPGRSGEVLVYDIGTGDLVDRLRAPGGRLSPEDRLAIEGDRVLRTGPIPRPTHPVVVWRDGQPQVLDVAANRPALVNGRAFLAFTGVDTGVIEVPAGTDIRVLDPSSGTALGQLDLSPSTVVGIGAGQGTLAIVTRSASGTAKTLIYQLT